MTIDEYLKYLIVVDTVRISNHIKKQIGDEDPKQFDVELDKLGTVKCIRKIDGT